MSAAEFIASYGNLGDLLRIVVPHVEPDDVEVVVRGQLPNERIGEAAVRMRVVTQSDVDRALDLQKRLRAGDPDALKELCDAAFAEARHKIAALKFMVPSTGVHS